MANTPNRVIRIEDDLWDAYGRAVAAKGSNRTAELRAHMQRVVRAHKRAGGDVDSTSGNQATHDDA